MWSIVLLVNSILLAISSTYLVYAIGAAILLGSWKELLLVLIITVVLGFAQIALGAIET